MCDMFFMRLIETAELYPFMYTGHASEGISSSSVTVFVPAYMKYERKKKHLNSYKFAIGKCNFYVQDVFLMLCGNTCC